MPELQRPEVLTLREAAEYLRINERTIFRLLSRGELRGRKVGREWRFHREDLEAFVRTPLPEPGDHVDPAPSLS